MDYPIELAKILGTTAGIVIIGVVLIREVFRFLTKPKNGNGNGSKLAGEMSAEHYNNYFEKVLETQRNQTEILRNVVAILGELRDFAIKEEAIKGEARRNRGEE